MARVTPFEVNEILVDDIQPEPLLKLKPFIDIANIIVTKYLTADTTLSDAELKEIERWLAAHLYAVSKGQMASAEKTLDTSITYVGTTGLGLDATTYGQTVKLMDVGGILSSIGERASRIDAITSF